MSSLVFQLTTVICGFIIPRLVLSEFGSGVNGLVSSIKQFLGIIAFLELGVGAVVQTSLYKPIAEKNSVKINEIITSANKISTKIGIILLVYVIILLFVFPCIVDKDYGWLYTTLLKSEWIIHMITVIAFTCTGILIVPFILVYTQGVTDVNYNQPLFAILITIAVSFVCLRLPYAIMILAAGHYKQTQRVHIIAVNIGVSIFMVRQLGLIGVALGTLIALAYQTIWMALYCSKKLIQKTGKGTVKLILIDILCVILTFFATKWLEVKYTSFFLWGISAVYILLIVLSIVVVVNVIFYKKYLLSYLNKSVSLTKKIKRRGMIIRLNNHGEYI